MKNYLENFHEQEVVFAEPVKKKTTEKIQCTGRTHKGKQCSRSACVGDRCKTHARNDKQTNQRAVLSDIVYHTHRPGIFVKTCQACLCRKAKENQEVEVLCQEVKTVM